MAQFSLLVLGAPYSTESSRSALRFAQAAIAEGHSLYRVFFYHDGINHGNLLITPPQDEMNIPKEWEELAGDHKIDLVVCIASALKRGVIDSGEAKRYQQPSNNLHPSFELSGLGQLIDASIHSDRLITFAP